MDLSFVIPVYNEEENVVTLHREITSMMQKVDVYFEKLCKRYLTKKYRKYEIIFIDDGSRDKTFENLSAINDSHVKVIKLRKNCGQSAAFLAGFHNASGDVVVTLDGDLQNDPADVPRLLVKLDDGFDCVSGWRIKRHDSFRVHLQSRISNYLRHKVISDSINDSGCSLKAYKKECLYGIELYGEMHRYIISLVALRGFKVGEIKVRHRARIHGKTNYKVNKIVKGFLDLWSIWFWQKYSSRPLHLFGTVGIGMVFFGFLSGIYALFMRIIKSVDFSTSMFTLIAVFLVILGFQFFIFGIIADIQMKNYIKLNNKTGYEIEKIIEKKQW